jgi:hypothetical protein
MSEDQGQDQVGAVARPALLARRGRDASAGRPAAARPSAPHHPLGRRGRPARLLPRLRARQVDHPGRDRPDHPREGGRGGGRPLPGLIVGPLGCRSDMIADAAQLGVDLHFVRTMDEVWPNSGAASEAGDTRPHVPHQFRDGPRRQARPRRLHLGSDRRSGGAARLWLRDLPDLPAAVRASAVPVRRDRACRIRTATRS